MKVKDTQVDYEGEWYPDRLWRLGTNRQNVDIMKEADVEENKTIDCEGEE